MALMALISQFKCEQVSSESFQYNSSYTSTIKLYKFLFLCSISCLHFCLSWPTQLSS